MTASPVSIIIPCYQQTQYLAECLASILNQTYTAWEIVVIDDGSHDPEILQIIKSKKDDRIRMIGLDKNLGLAAARNAGILNSSYDLVFPLDADDKIQPIALEKLVNALVENNADCAFADFQLFGSENGFWTFSGVTEGPEILKSQPIPGAGTLMTKSLWQKTGGYCEANEFRKGNEDWDFWLSAAHFKVIAAHIKEPLYLYRRYPNSMSLTLNADDYYVRRFMISRHRELFKRTGGARKFLADGFYNAASYYFSKGRIEGIIPLLRGLMISPNIRKSARSIRNIVRYFKKNENANE